MIFPVAFNTHCTEFVLHLAIIPALIKKFLMDSFIVFYGPLNGRQVLWKYAKQNMYPFF